MRSLAESYGAWVLIPAALLILAGIYLARRGK